MFAFLSCAIPFVFPSRACVILSSFLALDPLKQLENPYEKFHNVQWPSGEIDLCCCVLKDFPPVACELCSGRSLGNYLN